MLGTKKRTVMSGMENILGGGSSAGEVLCVSWVSLYAWFEASSKKDLKRGKLFCPVV